MKDPIKEHKKQGERLDEIFGWLSRTFGSKPETTPSSFLDAMNRHKESDTDADCSNMDVGTKLNRKAAGTSGTANVTIGTNKINNIKGLRFELLDKNGKGTGKFDNAIVNDFRCYDLDKDIYGIKWLFDDNCSYEAERITGDLRAGKKEQSLEFTGKWNEGKFYGKFMSGPDNFKGVPAPSATFAFFDFKTTSSTPTSKGKKKKKAKGKGKKTTPTAAGPTAPSAPPTTLAPISVGSVAPSPTTSAKTTPMTSRVAMSGPIAPTSVTPSPAPTSVTPSPAPTSGKKGKAVKIKNESKTPKPRITMRGFLDSFM